MAYMMYVQVYIWSFQAAFNFLSDDIELVYHYLIEYERSLPANEHTIGVIVERKRRSREMHEKQREYYRAIDHLNELNKTRMCPQNEVEISWWLQASTLHREEKIVEQEGKLWFIMDWYLVWLKEFFAE